jgi:DNA-binding response OmpR family regulator
MEMNASIERILLIDDDNEDCYIFKLVVNGINPAITVACNHECEGILDTIESFQPQLIFLDINLPRINGHNCLKLIKDSRHRNTPVVMYSSSFYEKDINVAYGLGASLYFGKTGKLDELKASMNSILQMAWHDPESITPQYFREGKYFPYSLMDRQP